MSVDVTPNPTRAALVSKRASVAKRFGPPILLFVILILAWDLLVRTGLVSDFILPLPGDVLVSMVELGTGELLWQNAWVTMYETVAGFVIGSGLAFVAAVFSGLSPFFRQMVYPYMIALQVTPRVAITPILIAWLGFGPDPKIVLAATICFFPVFINTLTGILSVDAESTELFRSLRASRWQTFRQLILPSAMPITFAGLKTAMTLALIGAIVGEFVSAQEGLGLLVQQFSFQLNMDAAFAVLLYLTVLGLLLYLVMEYLERYLVFWSHDARLDRLTRKYQAKDARLSPTVPASA
jgi:NitT/TauT family transport system permease protein